MPSNARTEKPEAIVVGSGLNALGVIRSLAPEEIAITVVDVAPGGPALHSRFATKSLYAPSADSAKALLDHLLARPVRDGPPVLFLTQEASVGALSAKRDLLKGKYRFVLSEHALLSDLMDKSRFQARAAQLGFPVPRSVIISNRDEAEGASHLTYPCILKPLTKNETWESRYKKAYRFDAFDALATFFAGIEGDPPPVIVQEWIQGADSDVYFTLVYRDETGRTRASFTGRKIRQWPPQVGGTASCTTAPEARETLAELTDRFFNTVGFVGMGSMEYKRDPRSGRFVMVEPTVGRSDYQEEVATLNGANVVRAAYRSLAGLPPLPDTLKPMTIWRDAMGDERSRHAQPDLRVPEEVANAPRVDALFRMNDPGPWLVSLAERISTRLRPSRS